MSELPVEPTQLDRKDLKIRALLEKVSSLTTQYENEVADLRVELTVMNEETNRLVGELSNQVTDLREQLESEKNKNIEVIEGEVVSEEAEKTSDDSD